MTDQYLGEIKIFAGNFVPQGWAYCDGQLLPIQGNTALFSLIGTLYGGDGQTTFALPDLRGRFPSYEVNSHAGMTNRSLGDQFGAETVTLVAANLPPHTHSLQTSSNAATSTDPTGNVLGVADGVYLEVGVPPDGQFGGTVGSNSGSTTPHNNLSPYLGVSFIIALAGIFPDPGGPR